VNPTQLSELTAGAPKGALSALGCAARVLTVGATLALGATQAGAADNRKEPPTKPESQAIAAIHDAMRAQDCTLAASRLNEALKRKYPSAYLLAGTMYEQGVCLKPDWDRAATLYQQATAAGEPQGRLRLVAGLAAGNRDRAAAMYWALEDAGLRLPAECEAGRELRADPDAYVAQLRKWPAGRLDACVYVAGVVSAIAGEIEYPSMGMAYSIYGNYRMSFNPSAATVEWTEQELRLGDMLGVSSGDNVRDRDSGLVRQTLRRELEETSQRTLRRFTRPADVPTGWRFQQDFAFHIVG
jgi:hypothetical protein